MSQAFTAGTGDGPLSGLLVADFTRALAGPYATMLLADMGADVIKVESPDGDDTRHWVPPALDGMATYFLSANRNKRSVVLDLGNAEDLITAKALVHRADVMIQNFRPGSIDKFGLGYREVAKSNPGLIYCSISGFGDKAGASLLGYDLLVQGMAGLMSMTGAPDGEPFRCGAPVFDVVTGLHSLLGILAALHQRQRTGVGQEIRANLMLSALSTLGNHATAYLSGGVVPRRAGNDHMSLFPYGPLRTGDGELIVAIGNDVHFSRLCTALGVPQLNQDERFCSVAARNVHREELRVALEQLLAPRGAAAWFHTLAAAGVPCGPINDIRQAVSLATELGLEPSVEIDGVRTVRHPIQMSGAEPAYVLPPPRLGEHTEQLRAWLRGPQSTRDSLAGADSGSAGGHRE